MLLYAMLALCALLIGLLVYRYDLHDREPWQMLLLAVVMGAGGMFLAGASRSSSSGRSSAPAPTSPTSTSPWPPPPP